MPETIGRINKFESFGLVDGPGIRYVIFMQGCSMRCKYCHNPETWDRLSAPISVTPRETFDRIYESYHDYWGDNGGVTFSGGEPLLQLDYLIETCRLFKSKGVHIAIDTSGQPFSPDNEKWMAKFDELLGLVDLFLFDIKQIDPKKHRDLTGWDNSNILQMASYLDAHEKDIWIRYVLVPGYSDSSFDLEKTHEFLSDLHKVRRIEVLPYHTLGIPKYEKLGIPYPWLDLKGPTSEEKEKAEKILRVEDYKNY